jgi:hypothetical protein
MVKIRKNGIPLIPLIPMIPWIPLIPWISHAVKFSSSKASLSVVFF